MKRGASIVALFALAVIACNVITGLSDEFQVESARIEAGAGDDSPSGIPPTPPGVGDGSPPDGSDARPGDASIDVPKTGFCSDAGSPVYVFCTDFEDTTLSLGGFQSTDLSDGSVKVENAIGRDGGRALHATALNAPDASRHAAALLMLGSTFTHYDVTFDFVVQTDALDYVTIGILGFNVAATTNYYGVAMHNHNLLDVSFPPGTDNLGVDASPGPAWHTANIVLDNSGGNTFNGKLYVDKTLCQTTLGLNYAAAPPEIHVGAFFTGYGAGTAEIYIDNVVVHAN
jgi:hypothetical protein